MNLEYNFYKIYLAELDEIVRGWMIICNNPKRVEHQLEMIENKFIVL